MSKTLVHADDLGTFVHVGGYAFRPPITSTLRAGDRVNAHHVGGSQNAVVGGETWRSYYGDPEYARYQSLFYPKDFREERIADVLAYAKDRPEQHFPTPEHKVILGLNEETASEPDPKSVPCDACNAKTGENCSQPHAQLRRVEVKWFHLSRIETARSAS